MKKVTPIDEKIDELTQKIDEISLKMDEKKKSPLNKKTINESEYDAKNDFYRNSFKTFESNLKHKIFVFLKISVIGIFIMNLVLSSILFAYEILYFGFPNIFTICLIFIELSFYLYMGIKTFRLDSSMSKKEFLKVGLCKTNYPIATEGLSNKPRFDFKLSLGLGLIMASLCFLSPFIVEGDKTYLPHLITLNVFIFLLTIVYFSVIFMILNSYKTIIYELNNVIKKYDLVTHKFFDK